jgi:hypothetical protein
VNGNFSFPFPLEPLLSCFRKPNGFMTNIPFAKCKNNLTAQCVFSTYDTHLWPIKGLSLELAKCLHKDTTTKILHTASELPYCVDRDKERVFNVAKWNSPKSTC